MVCYQVKKILKEVSGLGVHFNGSDLSDEGLYDFFGSLDDYYRISPEHAKIINWEVIDFPIPGNDDSRRSINLYCDLIHQTIETSKQEIVFEEKKETEATEQSIADESNNTENVDVKDPSTTVESE